MALLHGVSLASVAGMAHAIWCVLQPTVPVSDRARVEQLLAAGERLQPDRPRWSYDPNDPYWLRLARAQFTGGQPSREGPTVPDGGPPSDEQEFALCRSVRVLCAARGPRGWETVLVEYLEHGSDALDALHRVEIGDPLRPPLQRFVLVAVARDCRSVTFEERGAGYAPWPRHVLELEQLGPGPGVAGSMVPAPSGPGARRRGPSWTDVTGGRIVEVTPGERDYLRQHGNEFFQRAVGAEDYRSGSGARAIRGVRLTRLDRRLRKAGLGIGDVLVSLNGVQVATRLELMQTGRRLWRRGVRDFRVGFLRRGKLQEVVFRLPGKR